MESKYEEKDDLLNAICPYCGYEYQVENEDFDEDERREYCDECGKEYWLCQEITVTHITRPDCRINGQQHLYQETPKGLFFCTVCGDYTDNP